MRLDQFQLFLMVERLNGVYSKDAFDQQCEENGFDVVDVWSFITAIGQVTLSKQMYPDKTDPLDRYNSMMRDIANFPKPASGSKPCCGGGEVK